MYLYFRTTFTVHNAPNVLCLKNVFSVFEVNKNNPELFIMQL